MTEVDAEQIARHAHIGGLFGLIQENGQKIFSLHV
jgi:hypothetical protein